MTTSTIFVQEPDYLGFRRTNLPLQALGAVYDGRDPYATPLGIIALVLESSYAREVFVRRGESRMENGKIVYNHDLNEARYVANRNGFEEAQLRLVEGSISDEAKAILHKFFEAQNTSAMNAKFIVRAGG